MASNSGPRATRIVFVPWVAPDGQVKTIEDDVLADPESLVFEGAWVHVVWNASFSTDRQRSYPAHAIASIHHGKKT